MTSDISRKQAPALLSWLNRRSIGAANLIKTGYLRAGQMLPLVVEPRLEGILWWEWAEKNREFIEASLLKHASERQS